MTEAHRLLVLALAPFGDAALLAGPLRARRTARPGEHVTVAAPPGVCDVLRALGLADACWEVASPAPAARELYGTGFLFYRAHRARFDEVVDLFPHLRSLLAARVAQPARAAMRAPARVVDTLFRMRARVLGTYDPVARIADLLGVNASERPRYTPGAASDAWIERALLATGYRGGEPIVVVHSEGRWPRDRFVEVADRLRSTSGARLVVIDTPRGGKQARPLAGALGGTVLGVVSPSADRFFAAVVRAAMVLTDDPGVAYLSGFVRTPALLLGAQGRPLPPAGGYEALTAADVAEIGVETVFDAACKMIRCNRTGPLFGA